MVSARSGPTPARLAAPGGLEESMRAWRHQLHRHPETGFDVERTAELVAGELEAAGIDRAHRSEVDGAFHGCGHDGHTAMLLGAGLALAADPPPAGTFHLVFQRVDGARAPITGSEDFARLLDVVPGCYVNDGVLATGLAWWLAVVDRFCRSRPDGGP